MVCKGGWKARWAGRSEGHGHVGAESMKTAVAVPVLFFSLVPSGAGLAADTDRLEKALEEALGDEERICAVVRTLDREIVARPDDERLCNLRIAGLRLSVRFVFGRSGCGFFGSPASGFPGLSAARMPVCGSHGRSAVRKPSLLSARGRMVPGVRRGQCPFPQAAACSAVCGCPGSGGGKAAVSRRAGRFLHGAARRKVCPGLRAPALSGKLMSRMAVTLAHGGSSRMNTRRNSLCRTHRHAVR